MRHRAVDLLRSCADLCPAALRDSDRSELARLLRCLGPDDVVLVTRLDRLARSTPRPLEHAGRHCRQECRLPLAEYIFSAQYQQESNPPGGNRLRWEWFGTYSEALSRHDFQWLATVLWIGILG